MNNICKIIALMALVALTAGCTEETLLQPQEELTPLEVKASREPITRADDTYVGDYFKGYEEVGVYGYAYTSDWQPSMLPNFFNNKLMTLYDNGSSSFDLTYSPMMYWPGGGRKVSLFAYYPYRDDAIDIKPDVNYGMGTFTYSMPLNAADQIDFMVTPLLANQTIDNGTPKLLFYQTLARIEINVNLGASYKKIKKVEVTNLYTKGRFVPQVMNDCLNASPASEDWRTDAWPNDYLTDRYDIVVTGELSEGDSLDADSDDEYKLLVIPQQCIAGLTQIQLTLVDSSDATVTKSYDLTDLWKAGYVYSYTFTPTP